MLKVAIVMPTYNLEKYVAQAIESVLKQKTTFKFKLFIVDDCSTDNTLKIANDYAKNNIDKIEILTSERNNGLLSNTNRIFDGIQCEYLTNLDGDDYWVYDNQLQLQVDYMDAHKDCFLCAGNTQYLIDGKLQGFMLKRKKLNKKYTFQDYLNSKMPFFHTSSILLRNEIFIKGLPNAFKDVVGTFEECACRGEDFRRILHLEKGYLYSMDTVLSVYRIHDRGLWQGTSNLRHLIEGAIASNFRYKFFRNKYDSSFLRMKNKAYKRLIEYLLLEKSFKNTYQLDGKDNFLFTCYLNDIANDNNVLCDSMVSNLKKKINKIILKLF